MSGERISAALKEATDTRSVLIEARALASVADLFEQSFGDKAAVIVADENTFEIAGGEVRRHLEEAGRETVEPYVFPGRPTLYAGYENVEKLRDWLCEQDAIPIAVGSGTLNDIVKRSCYECDRPYMCVGTAASMDGYTAFGASITKDGLKQTLSCPAPRALLADVNVLVNAPLRMTASGYPDLLVAGAGPSEGVDRRPGEAARRRSPGDGVSDRGPGDIRPGDAVLPVVPDGLGRRAPVQPPVGDGGAGTP